jgi:alpha-amylase/alpha-mannosidase (GH57 family)
MPRIYLCFVWHMHQPFYKDLVSGQYKLPWTRMHALKDYYGMVKMLEDFPQIHQTFNLVPSMMVQLEEYAEGKAVDPFLQAALKPAETLTEAEQNFILRYFFQANLARMIYRYPRYGELWNKWQVAGENIARARRDVGLQGFRDLQVLAQLAWFDEEFLAKDPDVRSLAAKGREYTLEDQELMGRKQLEILGKVLPVYSEFSSRGQIEVSTTPFYHPILPLLCDSNIAEVAHPYVPLPPRFQYPDDARVQLNRARDYMKSKIGKAPAGMWPSEGSVSDEVFHLAAETGFRWAATDNGVLARTVHHAGDPNLSYRPYLWKQGDHQINVIFRDHLLSDLIGFVYSRMNAADAVNNFLDNIRNNCAGIISSGRDALVPIILDGENAWEYYEESGRPFLRELYRRIQEDPRMTALTVSEAFEKVEPAIIDHIFPGSWIDANFDIWIGFEEDNKAWEYLLHARQTYDRVRASPDWANIPEARRKLAFEELLIAEGSDWCWWYGPQHHSDNSVEFDQLFRDHLANVYFALGLKPPESLSRPILKMQVTAVQDAPTGPIRPSIDGEETSYFEWLGAGVYRVDGRSGAMHGQRFFVKQLRYGSDSQNLFLRLDFVENSLADLEGAEMRLNIQSPGDPSKTFPFHLQLNDEQLGITSKYRNICEVRVPLAPLGIPTGHDVRFQLSLWQNGLPMDALPPQGWIDFSTAEPLEWAL